MLLFIVVLLMVLKEMEFNKLLSSKKNKIMAKTSTKGTRENPCSMSECDSMLDAGTWPGGYVKDDAG